MKSSDLVPQRAPRAPSRARLIGLIASGLAAGAVVTLFAAEEPTIAASARSGGLATTLDAGKTAYSQLPATLTGEKRKLVADGRQFFETKWAFYWFEQGLWGRGPTSNAESCATCHVGNGRGKPPSGDEPAQTMVVRVSLPGVGPHGGPNPLPNYGDQLQTAGVPRLIAAEAQVHVRWPEREMALGDGELVRLRAPELRVAEPGYGPLGEEVLLSARVAPALIGAGLLDAVPDETLLALAARDLGDGIKGRPNHVWDIATQRLAIGRFGLKANHPKLRQQVAAAFIGDIGLSTSLFPEQNCPGVQKACKEMMFAGNPEITDYRLGAVETLVRLTAVPARRDIDNPQVQRGERVFAEAKCSACHVPELRTGDVAGKPMLSDQVIRPYTDLLLHDMGDELADNRPDFAASGRDWRTPPLWGIGLSHVVNGNAFFLHDGRARNFTEAILWHGGEGTVSREAFSNMQKSDREALVRFLESL